MKLLFTVVIFIFTSFSVFCQPSYYVSLSGSDANSGSITANWRTIQHACDVATPGSTVYIRAGTYPELLTMHVSGTAGNFITFTNFGTDVVTIDGGSTNTQVELLNITARQYIRIIGLRFSNAMGNFSRGIIIRGGASNIDILNNKILNINFSTLAGTPVSLTSNANPVLVFGDHISVACSNINIKGNEISGCRTGRSEALTLVGNVDVFTIDSNSIHDITNIGIDIAGGYGTCPDPSKDFARNGTISRNTVFNCHSPIDSSAGVYIDGGRDINVFQNISRNCARGFQVGCENQNKIADNIILKNNIAHSNSQAGIGFGGYNYPITGKVTNSKVFNNTSYNNATANAGGYGELSVSYTENCRIENNIFYSTNTINRLLVITLNSINLTLDYNLYFNAAGPNFSTEDINGFVYPNFSGYVNSGRDVNSVFGNPAFADISAFDFHIMNSSAGINKGNPAFIPAPGETDYYGSTRLIGSRVDCGASEYPLITAVTGLMSAGIVLKVFPIPAGNRVIVDNTDLSISSLVIFDETGKQTATFNTINRNKIELDISSYANGVYMITAFTKKNICIATGKIVIQK